MFAQDLVLNGTGCSIDLLGDAILECLHCCRMRIASGSQSFGQPRRKLLMFRSTGLGRLKPDLKIIVSLSGIVESLRRVNPHAGELALS